MYSGTVYYTDLSIGLDGYTGQHPKARILNQSHLVRVVGAGCITSGTLPSGFSPTAIYVEIPTMFWLGKLGNGAVGRWFT